MTTTTEPECVEIDTYTPLTIKRLAALYDAIFGNDILDDVELSEEPDDGVV